MSLLADQTRKTRWQQLVQALNPDLDPRSLRLMEEMRLVSHALLKIGEVSLANAGLSYAQYRILMSLYIAEEIDGREDLNPSEISAQQGTTRNTISGLIRSLEEAALIERHLDPQDRRKFNISLTETGRRNVRENARQHMSAVAKTFSSLSDEEQATLSQLLIKLGRGLDHPTHKKMDLS